MSEPLKDKFEADRASLAECARVVSRPTGIPVDGALAALRRCVSALGKRADGATWAREYLETSAAVECLAMALEQAAHPLRVAIVDGQTWERLSDEIRFHVMSHEGVTWLVNVAMRMELSAAEIAREPGNWRLVRESFNGKADADGFARWFGRRVGWSDAPQSASLEARANAARDAYQDAPRAAWQAVVRVVDASRPDPEHARVTMTPLDRLRVIAGLVMTLPHGKASHEVAFGHDEPAFTMLCESGANVTRNDLGDVGIILRAELRLDGVRFTAQKDGEGGST